MFGIPLFAIGFALKRFAAAAIPAVIAFAQTWIGGVAIAAVVSGIYWHHRGVTTERAACDERARSSVEIAREIDRVAGEKQLAEMRAANARLIQLRDQDNAEDAEQIAELERRVAAGTSRRCAPTDDDARRLRLK